MRKPALVSLAITTALGCVWTARLAWNASQTSTSDSFFGVSRAAKVATVPPPLNPAAVSPLPASPLVLAPLPPSPPLPYRTLTAALTAHSSLGQLLQKQGMLAPERKAMMDSLRPFLEPTRLATGTQFKVYFRRAQDPIPSRIDLRRGPTAFLRSERSGPATWVAHEEQVPVERRLAAYSGIVSSTLWNSAAAAGMDPQLIGKLSEVFAWQVDFSRGIRPNDRWRLTVERLYAQGEPLGYGDIVVAQFDQGGTVYAAVRDPASSYPQYYTPDGASLRHMFLRSPLHYAHITSPFTMARFHPILKISRPHLGIDYGAPKGTPIMAVGDGDVTMAAFRGGNGNMVAIKHNSIYETHYKHMSGFAPGIHAGSHVKMGDVIGYVGSTGLATGPHLHFEFHVGNQVVDPHGLKFPAAEAVAADKRGAFKLAATKALQDLPPWSTAILTSTSGETSGSGGRRQVARD